MRLTSKLGNRVSEISIGLICAVSAGQLHPSPSTCFSSPRTDRFSKQCLPSLSILMGKYRTTSEPHADRYVFPSILRNPRQARSILTTATESDETTREKSRNVRTNIVREDDGEEVGQP